MKDFYSVAEHSVRVAESCAPQDMLWGLLHDASEAYLVDLPRPIKRHSEIGKHYREVEDLVMIAICDRFGLTWQNPMPDSVERADKGMLWVEARDLMPPHPCWEKWRVLTTGRERPILKSLTPGEGEAAYLRLFRMLQTTNAQKERVCPEA